MGDHTEVMHELLCHPDIDLTITDDSVRTAEKMACPHVKNILHVFKSLNKKVGEYQKLTGHPPGIWRIAKETKSRAEKAEKKLTETTDRMEFLQKNKKESDAKLKKEIS